MKQKIFIAFFLSLISLLGSVNATTILSDTSINSTSLNLEGNATIAQKITFSLGEIIDNIVDGFVRVTGGVNITGDMIVGGNVGIGTDSPQNKLNVVGDLNVTGDTYLGNLTWNGNLDLGDNNITNVNGINFNHLNSENSTTYSNSIFNFAENVSNLSADEYKVMTFENQLLKSTNNPNGNTVSIAHWTRVNAVGGEPNHIVSLLGEAGLDSNITTNFVGTEGKAYANENGSIATGLYSLTYLNDGDNTNSIAYGVQGVSSALQGSGTGFSIGGAFSATGGAANYDIFLQGSKNIGAWNDAYSGINTISFSNTNLLLAPIDWIFTQGAGLVPQVDSEDYLGYTGSEWYTVYTNNLRSDTGEINFGDENISTTGNINTTSGFSVGGATGLTGNYSVGTCWRYYTGGIATSTNCTAL